MVKKKLNESKNEMIQQISSFIMIERKVDLEIVIHIKRY